MKYLLILALLVSCAPKQTDNGEAIKSEREFYAQCFDSDGAFEATDDCIMLDACEFHVVEPQTEATDYICKTGDVLFAGKGERVRLL